MLSFVSKEQEVNPLVGIIPKVFPRKLFLDMLPSLPADNVITRVAWMFSRRRKTVCQAAWAVHVSNIRVTGLAVSFHS